MSLPPPLRYFDAIEDIRPDEDEVMADLIASFDHILQTTCKDYGHAVRAVHAKTHAVLKGRLTIDDSLPPELAQGMFARPGTHEAWLRISTNPGDIISDAVSLPRGIGLKIEDVEGERLAGAEGRSQDFLMVNGPVFASATTADFARELRLVASTTDRAEGAKVALSKTLQMANKVLGSVGLQSTALAGIGGAPQSEPLGETYFSATPYRYGRYVAKFRLRPLSPALTALTGKEVPIEGRENALRERLREEMAGIDGEWAFEVQLARDLDRQPIEDASVEWDETEAPFVQVATLRIGRQDSWDEERVRKVDETMRFSPWTGLAAHRPLGNVNRARKDTYQHSASFRARANGCPIHEI